MRMSLPFMRPVAACLGFSLAAAMPVIAAEATQPTFGRLPLYFFPNQGQMDAKAQFAGRVGGLTAFLTDDGFALRLAERKTGSTGFEGVNLFLTFEGRSPDVSLAGERVQEGKVNFFKGQDPSKWVTNVPTFDAVRYHGMYEGIDVLVRDNARKVQYDLLCAPGADLSQVVIRVEGADGLRIDADGSLVAMTRFGELRQDAPITWMENSDGTRTDVKCQFTLVDGNRFGFIAPDRDPSLPLVVDPGITYGSYLGGSANEHGCGVSVDSKCSMFIAGDTLSIDFPVLAGAFDLTHNGNVDSFVTKLVGTGTTLLFSTYIGGTDGDFGHGVYVTHTEESYITGGTGSSDYPVTPGAFDTTFNGGSDTYVTKLSADGSTLIYSTFLGGVGEEGSLGGQGIGVDANGFAYVAGFTSSANFPTTPGAYDTTYNDNGFFNDTFVTKVSQDGSSLVYSTLVGGDNIDFANALAVSPAGEAFVGGFSLSTNFPTTPGAFETVPNGNSNGYLLKMNLTGTALVYSTFIGGSSEVVRDVAWHTDGTAFATGYTLSNVYPATPGAFQTAPGGNGDGFISRFNATGTGVVYATYIGGTQIEVGNAVEADENGDAYLTGWTESSLIQLTPGGFDTTYNGGPQDAYVYRLDPTGANLLYGSYLGGSAFDVAFAMNIHDVGAAYIAGGTFSTDFPTVAGSFDTTPNGGEDIFMALLPVGPQSCTYASSAQMYGLGKAGLTGVPTLANLTQPKVPSLGLQIQVANAAPNSLVYFVVGTNNTILPFDSGLLLTNPAIVQIAGVTDGLGTLTVSVPIVDNPNYCGKEVRIQALVQDASVGTYYGLSMTNGLHLIFGN